MSKVKEKKIVPTKKVVSSKVTAAKIKKSAPLAPVDTDKIFIQIASYRDPELLPTLIDCLENAKYPERLVFGIAWQHSSEDAWDTLYNYKDDPRFKIIDIDYTASRGVCWARKQIGELWDGEKYTLQLDSHHRFVKDWDVKCVDMFNGLLAAGYKKPLISGYIPSYDPDNDPGARLVEPWVLILIGSPRMEWYISVPRECWNQRISHSQQDLFPHISFLHLEYFVRKFLMIPHIISTEKNLIFQFVHL
jgi:Glycosyltransferase (GlcNAc)